MHFSGDDLCQDYFRTDIYIIIRLKALYLDSMFDCVFKNELIIIVSFRKIRKILVRSQKNFLSLICSCPVIKILLFKIFEKT